MHALTTIISFCAVLSVAAAEECILGKYYCLDSLDHDDQIFAMRQVENADKKALEAPDLDQDAGFIGIDESRALFKCTLTSRFGGDPRPKFIKECKDECFRRSRQVKGSDDHCINRSELDRQEAIAKKLIDHVNRRKTPKQEIANSF